MSATSLEYAGICAAKKCLRFFEQSVVSGQAGTEAVKSLHKENVMLKEQMEVVLREYTILKTCRVAIQHKRQKEHEDKNRELRYLKEGVSQNTEQSRVLECCRVHNYAMLMHLRLGQQSKSFLGSYPPDVF